jgi:adenylate cyclase 5
LVVFVACIYCIFFSFLSAGGSGCSFTCEQNLTFVIQQRDNKKECGQPFKIELVYESVLIILLSVCMFLSLLSLEKMLIAFLLAVISILAIWLLPYHDLHLRQFYIWHHRKVSDFSNSTIAEQLQSYCLDYGYFSDLRCFFTFFTIFAFCMITIQSRRSEMVARYDFIWKLQAAAESNEMKKNHDQNRLILENILPAHVAAHFLTEQPKNRSELYSEGRPNACVIFATISGFNEFYMELDGNNEGVECLRLLNEIIADFDQLLNDPELACIEKIKTISTTYMAASGLTGDVIGNQHVVAVTKFALKLLNKLEYINEHSFNNFNLRIGKSLGKK